MKKKTKLLAVWEPDQYARLLTELAMRRNTEFQVNKSKSVVVNINGVTVELFSDGRWELVNNG